MYVICSPTPKLTKYDCMETSNNQAIFQATLRLPHSALIVALVDETTFTLESL